MDLYCSEGNLTPPSVVRYTPRVVSPLATVVFVLARICRLAFFYLTEETSFSAKMSATRDHFGQEASG